jgi:hypothetical protein
VNLSASPVTLSLTPHPAVAASATRQIFAAHATRVETADVWLGRHARTRQDGQHGRRTNGRVPVRSEMTGPAPNPGKTTARPKSSPPRLQPKLSRNRIQTITSTIYTLP